MKPLINDFGWDRASVSLAMSIYSLTHGIMQPISGMLVDRFGPKRVVSLSLVVTGLGLMATSMVSQLWQIYLFYGVFTAMGFGGSTMVSLSALVARWFVKRRGLAISLVAAGLSAGQFVILPITMALILSQGWRQTYLLMGGFFLAVVVPVTLILMKDSPAQVGSLPYGYGESGASGRRGATATEGKTTTLREAMATRPFWLLALGYFVCGFTITMLQTHLVPFATDIGIDEMVAANALGLMGAFSAVGSIVMGFACDRWGRKNPLAATYFLRGMSLLILLGARSEVGLYLVAIVGGLSYIATVPPTSALVADIYGQRSMGVLLGMISLSHQIGSATGVYLGGVVFDATGSYSWPFSLAFLAAMVATAASYLIREPARAAAPPVKETAPV
ncbi:MAG: MFS transporter [Chloroflexi bacterium]|nr:MFS transporter [Chloroflexota bacterium]